MWTLFLDVVDRPGPGVLIIGTLSVLYRQFTFSGTDTFISILLSSTLSTVLYFIVTLSVLYRNFIGTLSALYRYYYFSGTYFYIIFISALYRYLIAVYFIGTFKFYIGTLSVLLYRYFKFIDTLLALYRHFKFIGTLSLSSLYRYFA